MIPAWLTVLSDFFVVLGAICVLIIALDAFYHPQEMWVRNVVWPVVALFGTGFTLWV